MSAISTDEVARVAALARVALSEEEVTRLAGELDAVASSFARVTSVVSPDLPATSHPVPLTNVLREDVAAPTLDVDELLSGAPASEDSKFLVPQILGEDSASRAVLTRPGWPVSSEAVPLIRRQPWRPGRSPPASSPRPTWTALPPSTVPWAPSSTSMPSTP